MPHIGPFSCGDCGNKFNDISEIKVGGEIDDGICQTCGHLKPDIRSLLDEAQRIISDSEQ